MRIKEICTCDTHGTHISNLLFSIENVRIDPKELEGIISSAIIEAKEKRAAVHLCYGGNFDLLVTECRIHVICAVRSFEHPTE